MFNLPDPVQLRDELNSLLDVRSRINARIRRLTGESDSTAAARAAAEWVTEWRESEKRRKNEYRLRPDERGPSRSVRTVSGGLPTLGKQHR